MTNFTKEKLVSARLCNSNLNDHSEYSFPKRKSKIGTCQENKLKEIIISRILE